MKTIDFQRYIFRLIKQKQNESFDSFFQRLREQEKKCNFADSDERMKEQIIAECSIKEFRDRAFEDEINLDQLIFMARTLERENRIDKRCSRITRSCEKPDLRRSCTRCGSKSHKFYNVICPALTSICVACKKRGHFSAYCKSRKLTRKRSRSRRSASTETVKVQIDRRDPSSKDTGKRSFACCTQQEKGFIGSYIGHKISITGNNIKLLTQIRSQLKPF